MGRYRKKSVVVEAVQWWKHGDHPAVQQYGESIVEQYPAYAACGFIDTLEGRMHVRPSAWIITGVKGEEYPCEPDIFDSTYEPEDSYPRSERLIRAALIAEISEAETWNDIESAWMALQHVKARSRELREEHEYLSGRGWPDYGALQPLSKP